jgi:hypothetical protein
LQSATPSSAQATVENRSFAAPASKECKQHHRRAKQMLTFVTTTSQTQQPHPLTFAPVAVRPLEL